MCSYCAFLPILSGLIDVIWTMMAMNLLYEFILMRQFHFITRWQRQQPIVATRLLYRYFPIEAIELAQDGDAGNVHFRRKRKIQDKFYIKEDFHCSIFRMMIFRNLLY